MRFKRRSPCFILAALVLLLLPSAALAQVSVYAEGAWTATDLVVNIYADITGSPLCSYGVLLNYEASKLTVSSATVNDAVWYFGSPPPSNTACPNCVTTSSGKIIFIGGKLDTTSPTQGVSGSRVLLGKATFNRVAGQNPPFVITLELGKTHPPFDNFVTSVAPATVLDGSVAFTTVKIFERGDANGDGNFTVGDYITIRNYLNSPNPPPYVDCNGDEAVTVGDYLCVRNKM
jgi:hypothetical protein